MTEETVGENPEASGKKIEYEHHERIFDVKKVLNEHPNIDVTFLYILHTTEAGPEYVGRVLERVANADLVLMEAVGQTQKMRQLNSLVFKVLSVAAEKAPDNLIVRKLTELLRQSDLLHLRVMGEVLGSGKEVDFIDVAEDEPGYTELVAARETNEHITTLVEEGETEKAFQLYPGLIDLYAESSKLREGVVVEQLKERFESIKEKNKLW